MSKDRQYNDLTKENTLTDNVQQYTTWKTNDWALGTPIKAEDELEIPVPLVAPVVLL